MWEWEAPPEGDDETGGGPNLDPSAIIEAQKADLARRKEQAKIELEINTAIDSRISAYKNIVDISRKEVQQLEQFHKETEKINQALKAAERARLAAADGTEEQQKAAQANYEAALEASQKQEAAQKRIVKELLKSKTLGKGIKKELEDAFQSGDPEKIQKAMAKAQAELDNVETTADEVGGAFQSLARSVGFSADVMETGLGKALQKGARLTLAFAKNPFAGIAAGANALLGALSPLNLFAMAFKFMIDIFKESEEAAIDVTKSFGGTVTENQRLLADSKGMALDYNASLGEVGKTLTNMQGALAGFDKSMAKQHSGLIENSLAMKKLGVDEKALLVQTNKLRFAFGGSSGNIEKAHTEIVQFAAGARNLGYTMNESIQVLAQFGGSVASMGGNMTSTLQDMMAMSKATGAEMSKLLSIAKKFNTFKEGADMAAKLNSVFGTSISQINLMGKTAPERNKIIAESLKNATGGYASMTDHQRLAAAEMLGFGDDVEQLRTYMEGQTEAAKKAEETRKQNAASMAELRQAAMDIVPTLTELANEFKKAFIKNGEFKVMMDKVIAVIPQLVELVTTLANAVAFMVDNWKAVVAVYALVKTAMVAFATYQKVYLAQLASGAAIEKVAGLSKVALGTASYYAIGAIAALALILGVLFVAFHKSGSPQLWEIAGAMSIFVLALGAAFYFAGPALMAALPALIVIMAGLVGIFYVLPPLIEAVSGLAGAFTDMVVTVVGNVGGLYLVAGALMAIGGAFFFLGQMALIASLGIAAGSVALLALRATMAISGTKFSDLMDIGEGVSKMGEGIKNLKEGISGLGAAGNALAKGLGDKNLVVTGDARGATVLAGKGGMFAFIPPKITVDVNMDEMEMAAPNVNVNVTLDGDQLRYIISEEIANSR